MPSAEIAIRFREGNSIAANSPGFQGMRWFDTRRGQMGIRLGTGLRLVSLGFLDRVRRDQWLTRLADLLPKRHVKRRPAIVQNQDQRQGDRCFASRHGQDHDCEDLSRPVSMIPAESDQREGNALKHHLGGKEHHDQVPPREKPDHSDREKCSTDEEITSEHLERENIGHGTLVRENESRIKDQTEIVAVVRSPGRTGGLGLAIAIAPINPAKSKAPASSTTTR